MRVVSAAVAVLLTVASSAGSEIGAGLKLAGTYLCGVDAGGGVVYSDATKKWSGTVLHGGQQFVFKVALIGQVDTTKQSDTFKSAMGLYNATLTYAGTDQTEACDFRGSTKISIGDEGILQCDTLYGDFIVGLETLRISMISGQFDYVNGYDRAGGAAGMQVGICIKVE